jgi:hypothetical protein
VVIGKRSRHRHQDDQRSGQPRRTRQPGRLGRGVATRAVAYPPSLTSGPVCHHARDVLCCHDGWWAIRHWESASRRWARIPDGQHPPPLTQSH